MNDYKTCTKCKNDISITFFCKDKKSKDGLSYTCRECSTSRSNKWKKENKPHLSNYQKSYYNRNKSKIKNYIYTNREHISNRMKRWRRENQEKNRLYRRNYCKKRKSNNIEYRITCNLRNRLLDALAGRNKSSATLQLLGCSASELKIYLENRFTLGMTWDNYGRNGWHIDHIIPCSVFDLKNPEQQKKCFHYTNLQPLWAIDNYAKGNKINMPPPDLHRLKTASKAVA